MYSVLILSVLYLVFWCCGVSFVTQSCITQEIIYCNMKCFPPPCQVENIENPLGSFGRVEADNGVHMRVESFLEYFFLDFSSFVLIYNWSWICFFSDCVTGSRQQARTGLKCRREVFSLWIWGLWKALHHCPPPQGKSILQVDNISSLHLPVMLSLFSFLKSTLYSFVYAPCRYTSVHTLETNHTSVTILAVGKSLQQVTVEN